MDAAAARDSAKMFHCQKSDRDIPLAEPRCLNPKAYCKWRTACPIHLLEKEAARKTQPRRGGDGLRGADLSA